MFEIDQRRRTQWLVCLGAASLALFVLLRTSNVHGDPADWTLHDTTLRTLLSFVNVQKYPPSLQYLLLTLGAGSLLLAAFESARGKVSEVLRTFGRVPLVRRSETAARRLVAVLSVDPYACRINSMRPGRAPP